MSTKSQTQKMVGISMLAAVSLVISFFSFPIIPAVPFLKLDFGDIPILLGMFAYGPGGGVLIALMRSLLHYVFTGGEMGIPIGDTAAFIASISLTLPIYFSLMKFGFNLKGKVAGLVTSTISLTTILTLLNYFVLLPLYSNLMNLDVGPIREYILGAVVPFNALKAIVVAMVFYVIWRVIEPWMEKQFRYKRFSQQKN